MKISELKDIIIKEFGEEEWQSFKETIMYKVYNLPEKERIKELRWYGEFIKYINNPTKREQKTAIKQNWRSIRYIENPSEELQLLALSITHYSLLYMHNLSERVIKEAVNGNSFNKASVLKYIENDLKEEE